MQSGPSAADAEALAGKVLGMTPLDAKRATKGPMKGGKLSGLDVKAWDEVKARVMAIAAMQQADGCKAFAEMLAGTGDALLAEAKSFDSWWGIASLCASLGRKGEPVS